ncbi:MAG: MFS transporter [Gammaproteobacteria bacterium]|nr:MFS transporter [Gammaproteobacteria bacterium]
MTEPPRPARDRFLAMLALVVGGEMIFSLPFHLPRYFRPSVLETLGLSNAQLGDVFAVYGVTAMLAYFPGGALADRFEARRLMALSLLATAAGGLYLATLPGPRGLAVLYGYWGLTTILLFWAAMIRATRDWGGETAQGRAFGTLDGGRGLAAATFASLAVAGFAWLLPEGDYGVEAGDRARAMQAVILFYAGVTALAAVLVLRWLPAALPRAAEAAPAARMRSVLGQPLVWLQALIVVCAYCGYKGLDNYALYAYDVLGMSETRSAAFTASSAYIRPLAAIVAGLVADRIGAGRAITGLFGILVVSYALLATLDATPAFIAIVYANLIVTYAAVFALRGVYFALLEATRVPATMTGAAVGLVSVVGFTPDIFFAPIAGRLLDAAPGMDGHQHYFALLAAIAVVGLVTAGLLSAGIHRQVRAARAARETA